MNARELTGEMCRRSKYRSCGRRVRYVVVATFAIGAACGSRMEHRMSARSAGNAEHRFKSTGRKFLIQETRSSGLATIVINNRMDSIMAEHRLYDLCRKYSAKLHGHLVPVVLNRCGILPTRFSADGNHFFADEADAILRDICDPPAAETKLEPPPSVYRCKMVAHHSGPAKGGNDG